MPRTIDHSSRSTPSRASPADPAGLSAGGGTGPTSSGTGAGRSVPALDRPAGAASPDISPTVATGSPNGRMRAQSTTGSAMSAASIGPTNTRVPALIATRSANVDPFPPGASVNDVSKIS